MAIKIKKINEEGKEIIKEVDEGLYSSYINIGWKEVKEEKDTKAIFKSKIQPEKTEEIKDGKDI